MTIVFFSDNGLCPCKWVWADKTDWHCSFKGGSNAELMAHLLRWSFDDEGNLKDKYHFAANVWFAEAFPDELASAGVAAAGGGAGVAAAGGGAGVDERERAERRAERERDASRSRSRDRVPDDDNNLGRGAGGDDSVASDSDSSLFSNDKEGAGAGDGELWAIDRVGALM
jgi:hypothetical protein